MGVAGASGGVTDGAGAGSTVLHRAASVGDVAVEDLSDTALRGIRNPITKDKKGLYFFYLIFD